MTTTMFSSITPNMVSGARIDSQTGVLVGECTERVTETFPLVHSTGIALAAPSVASLLMYVKRAMPSPSREKASSKEGSSDGFYSFDSYEDAWDTFAHRPYELAVFREADSMIRIFDTPGIEIDFDVVGDDLDMGRFLEGDPLCYSHMVMGNSTNVVATLYVSTSAPYWVGKSAFAAKVARICRLCDWLETNRVRTRIIAIEANQCGLIEVTVKDFADPMYLPNVAVVAHGDFLRRIIFRVNEHSKTWQHGYGTAINLGDKNHFKSRPSYGEITFIIDQPTDVDSVNAAFDEAEAKTESVIPDINNGLFNSRSDWPLIAVKGYGK